MESRVDPVRLTGRIRLMLSNMLMASAVADKDLYRSRTTALLSCNGANASTTVTDDSLIAANWTCNGAAALSTTQYKFGTAALSFSGATGTYISPTADASNYAFGTGDFTIEMWIYFTGSASTARVIYDSAPISVNTTYPRILIAATTANLTYYANSAARISGTAISTNTWYHIAVARSGTSTRMFIDGTQVGSTYTDSTNYLNNGGDRPRIGANANTDSTQNFIGYIDDVRTTKGAARYTANFTPPAKQFPVRG